MRDTIGKVAVLDARKLQELTEGVRYACKMTSFATAQSYLDKLVCQLPERCKEAASKGEDRVLIGDKDVPNVMTDGEAYGQFTKLLEDFCDDNQLRRFHDNGKMYVSWMPAAPPPEPEWRSGSHPTMIDF